MSREYLLEDYQQNVASDNHLELRQARSRQMKGILYANLYCVLQTVFQVGIKVVFNQGVSFFTVLLARYLIGTIIDSCFMVHFEQRLDSGVTSPKVRVVLYLRTALFLLQFYCFFTVIQVLPVAILSLVLNFQGFWAMIIAYFVLNDKITLIEIVCAILGYVGVVFIVIGIEEESSNISIVGLVVALCMSVVIGFTIVLTRFLQQIHYSVIQIHTDIFGLFITGLLYIGDKLLYSESAKEREIDSAVYILMIVAIIFSCLSMLIYSLSVQLAKASVISAVFYALVLYNFLGDLFIFEVSFTPLQLAGGALIIGVNLYLAFVSGKK